MGTQDLIQQLVPTLYEDDFLLAVDKPAGVDTGGRGDRTTTGLANILSDAFGLTTELRPINRLARYESGVLLMGKDRAIVEHIQGALKAGSVRQQYLAVVLARMRCPRLDITDPMRDAAHRSDGRKEGGRARSVRKPARAAAGAKAHARTGRSDGLRSPRDPNDRRMNVTALKQGKNRTCVRCRTTVQNTHTLRARLRGARLRVLGDGVNVGAARRVSADLTCLHLEKMSFYHPVRRAKITVTGKPPAGLAGAVEGKRDICRVLRAGLTRRIPCILEPQTDAYRLLTGDVEDLKGLVAEKYGQVVILQVRGAYPVLTEALDAIARWYHDALDVQAVYVRHVSKDRSGVGGDSVGGFASRRPLVGKAVPDEIGIRERGLAFVIRPHEGLSIGLFLDQRENRSRIREMAGGKDVLNLFAHTCGFSVAAAVGGANSIVSVDLSPRHLEWGKANFALNGLDPTVHQFIRSDAIEYLKRAGRQGRPFDLILIDAPTFAHARRGKQSFSIARDLPALVGNAAGVLRPGGSMMLSTNNRKLSMRPFKELIHEGAGSRPYRIISEPPLPVDFAVDREHAKTIFARFT